MDSKAAEVAWSASGGASRIARGVWGVGDGDGVGVSVGGGVTVATAMVGVGLAGEASPQAVRALRDNQTKTRRKHLRNEMLTRLNLSTDSF
jgi:hypothetical protein